MLWHHDRRVAWELGVIEPQPTQGTLDLAAFMFTHTTRLIKELQSRCFPFEMMAYPGSKHALQEQSVSIHRFNLILDFFERSLT